MSRFTALIRASLLCAASVAFVPIAAADPYEADPDLATRLGKERVAEMRKDHDIARPRFLN